MYTVNLTCKCCSVDFVYAGKEYKRQTKKGRTEFFCSRSCALKWRNQNRSPEEQAKISAAISKRSLKNQYAKKGDFTFFLNKSKNRKKDFDLDEEYLRSIWSGKCALSGIDIVMKSGRNTLTTASLDRIDSSKGYVKGNVQFVAYGINLAKNSFDETEIKEFLARLKN